MTKEEERGINMFRDYLINDCSKDHLVKELDGLVKEYKAKQLILSGVVVPKGTLCCPECNSTNLKNAIHTDYKECNKCCHYWEHNAL